MADDPSVLEGGLWRSVSRTEIQSVDVNLAPVGSGCQLAIGCHMQRYFVAQTCKKRLGRLKSGAFSVAGRPGLDRDSSTPTTVKPTHNDRPCDPRF
jgi:hypothetical protein